MFKDFHSIRYKIPHGVICSVQIKDCLHDKQPTRKFLKQYPYRRSVISFNKIKPEFQKNVRDQQSQIKKHQKVINETKRTVRLENGDVIAQGFKKHLAFINKICYMFFHVVLNSAKDIWLCKFM